MKIFMEELVIAVSADRHWSPEVHNSSIAGLAGLAWAPFFQVVVAHTFNLNFYSNSNLERFEKWFLRYRLPST